MFDLPLNASVALCRAQNGVILREDHVTLCIRNVTLCASAEIFRRRLLFKGVMVSESKITPPFGLRRKSLRVLYRVLQTGELALKIAVPAWSVCGSDTGEFFDQYRPIGKCPGFLPLPPGSRIDIDVMKLGKVGLRRVEHIWSERLSHPNPLPIYVRAKGN